MERWRRLYDEYNKVENKQKYEELKNRVEGKNTEQENSNKNIKEVYAEYMKMKKVYDNMPKVENLMEYMEKLDEELGILKAEYQSKEDIPEPEEIQTKLQELDKEIEENMQKQEELEKSLKVRKKALNSYKALKESGGELKPEDLERMNTLEEEIKKFNADSLNLKEQAKINNMEFRRYQGMAQNKPTNVIEKLSKEELREKCFEVSSQLSKCNLVASSLLKGYGMESIELKLKDFKEAKFTSKTPLPLTKKELNEKNPKANDKTDDKSKNIDDLIKEKLDEIDEEKQKPLKNLQRNLDNALNEKIRKDGKIENEKYEDDSLKKLVEKTNAKKKESNETDIDKLENELNQDEVTELQDSVQLPANLSEFEKAFPKLAKRFPNMEKNFLGKILLWGKQHFGKSKDTKLDKNEDEKAEPQMEDAKKSEEKVEIQKENMEKAEEKPEKSKNAFKEYLKYDVMSVAEKGINGIDAENEERDKKAKEKAKEEAERIKAEKREKAKIAREEAKKAAWEREANDERLGKKYANMSYKNEEKDGEER